MLLYELLTGSQPFPDKRLRSAGWKEMQRIIQEEEPPRPSTRLSTLNESERTTITKNHPEGLGRISVALRRELDWIVMMCLEKDRSRRYETANGLAMDIGRYLKGDAIIAVPPSKTYQLSKLIRKHKKTFAMAAAVAVILAVSAVFSTYQAIVANRERAIAKAVSDFLDHDLLQQADVYNTDAFQSPHRDLKLLDVVNRASTNLVGKFEEQPVVEASIRLTLGKIFVGLGELLPAQEHLEKAMSLFREHLGEEDERYDEARFLTGRVHLELNDPNTAKELMTSSVEYRKRRFGDLDSRTAVPIVQLAAVESQLSNYSVAESMLTNLLVQSDSVSDFDSFTKLQIKEQLYSVPNTAVMREGDLAEKIELLMEDYQELLGPYHPDSIRVTLHAASAKFAYFTPVAKYNLPKAYGMTSEALRRCNYVLGDRFPKPDILSFLSTMEYTRGLVAEALAKQRKAIKLSRSLAGLNHPRTIAKEFWMGQFYRMQEKPMLALKTFDQAIVKQSGLVEEGEHTLYNLGQKLFVTADYGFWDENIDIQREIVEVAKRIWGPDSPRHFPETRLATALCRMGRWEEAARALKPLLESDYANRWNFLKGALYNALAGNIDVAQEYFEEASSGYSTRMKQDRPDAVVLTALALDEIETVDEWFDTQVDTNAFPFYDGLLLGMHQFRKGNIDEAIELLAPVNQRCRDRIVGTIAGYYLSLARKELSDDAGAVEMLRESNRVFDELQTAGVYSNLYGWSFYLDSVCLLARREAHQSIESQTITPEQDARRLERFREGWAPLRIRIEEGIEHARHQRWKEAAEIFRETINAPNFSWEAGDLVSQGFRFKLALIFVLAGDAESYRAICEKDPDLAAIDRQGLGEFDGLVSTVFWFGNEAEVSESLIGKAWTHYWQRNTGEKAWMIALQGLTDYKSGRLAEAALKFTPSENTFRLTYACFAKAMNSAVLSRQSRSKEAQERLSEAETIWKRLLDNHPDGWAGDWRDMALCQIALNEAQKRMGEVADVAALQNAN